MRAELKQISRAGVPAALAKAEKYRLLNEPDLAESICLDILAVEPEHEVARVTLLLALTDQFDVRSSSRGVRPAEELVAKLGDAYDRAYYGGLIEERWALALLDGGDPGAQAFDWLSHAMDHYEQAQALCKAGNDDPILRWNTCVRLIERKGLAPRADGHEHIER